MKISTYAKAIIAAFVAASGALSTAAVDDVITATEAWLIAGSFVGGLGFTWAIPNKPTTPRGDA